jgi:hypothetical protein
MAQKQDVPVGTASGSIAEVEAVFDSQAFVAPPRRTVQPLPTIRPRTKRVRTAQAGDDRYYFDPNDGMIKPEPETRSRQAPVQAATYEWD